MCKKVKDSVPYRMVIRFIVVSLVLLAEGPFSFAEEADIYKNSEKIMKEAIQTIQREMSNISEDKPPSNKLKDAVDDLEWQMNTLRQRSGEHSIQPPDLRSILQKCVNIKGSSGIERQVIKEKETKLRDYEKSKALAEKTFKKMKVKRFIKYVSAEVDALLSVLATPTGMTAVDLVDKVVSAVTGSSAQKDPAIMGKFLKESDPVTVGTNEEAVKVKVRDWCSEMEKKQKGFCTDKRNAEAIKLRTYYEIEQLGNERKLFYDGKITQGSDELKELINKLPKNLNKYLDLCNKIKGLQPWTPATVLSQPINQPKIMVQKVADTQNVKPGEKVTYVYSVTNTGTIPLEKVQITDDKCAPVTYLRGGTNYAGGILAPNETWEYQCAVTLKTTTENTATVEAYTSTKVKVTGQAKAKVTAVFCPPSKVKVPYLLYMTTDEAKAAVQNSRLRFLAGKAEYSDYFTKGTVMDQAPRDDACVDPGSTVSAVISLGTKPDKPAETTPAKLTAEMDCGDSFELRPGDVLGRTCYVTVRGWRSNTEDRVELKIRYDRSSGIEDSGDFSVPPSLMYTAGVSDYNDRYIFKPNFKARDNAPKGTIAVTLTILQKGAEEVSLPLRIAVLAKGQLPSSGPGIRPPATVQTGSGGNFCVWRYKLFGDPPACFHFVAAVCGKYGMPNYELVGDKMTRGEADARVGQLSRYFDDQYGCTSAPSAQAPPAPAGPTTLNVSLDCGGGLELVPGELSKPCNVIISGWRKDTTERVNVKVKVADGPLLGMIETIPGNTSADPGNMYTGGASTYTFSEGFSARYNARPGTARVTITVSQVGAGEASVPLDLKVLGKGATASSGPGIRPPAQVAAGSGGTYCVWRYKMFGDPPPCFHFVAAVCGKYGPPNYELVGDKMTFGEADARVGQLSRYFDDQYGCSAPAAQPTKPKPAPDTKPPAPPPPPPCIYTYSGCLSDCQPDNTCNVTVKSKTPVGCEGTPVLIGSCIYKPPPPVLTRFGVYCSPSQIDQNGTATCKATGEYSNAIGTYVDLTARAAWSAGPNFSGKGRQDGSYTITASLEGASDTATVTVTKGYDPNKDPGIPGKDKPVDPEKIKGPMDGFSGGSSQGTRPPKPQDPQTTVPIPPEYTKPPDQPQKPPDKPGIQPPTQPGGDKPTTPPQPTKPGIDVTVVGTAPPGKCTIVTGQLVAVEKWPVKIAGMTVVLTGPVTKSASSSGGGAFSFQDLPAGKYVISVKQWNWGMTKADFVCESGKAVKVVMKGSCPFLYVWNGSTYEKENDIYSVARLLPQELLSDESRMLAQREGTSLYLLNPEHMTEKIIKEKSMVDYYRMARAPIPDAQGNYRLKIVEQAHERSFTDRVRLLAVDHPRGTRVDINREGQSFIYENLVPVKTRKKAQGKDFEPGVSVHLYNGEFIEFSLRPKAGRKGLLVVSWQGFQDGTSEGHSESRDKPRLTLQVKDGSGKWQTIDWVYPRDEVQTSFLKMEKVDDYSGTERTFRLLSTSCQAEKYHRLDRIEWGEFLSNPLDVQSLPLLSAVKSDGSRVLQELKDVDGSSLVLGPEEEVALIFQGRPLPEGVERTFIFASEGFYVPMPLIRMAER